MITIILTGSCVSASIVEKAFPLDFLLPSLQEILQGDSTGFVKIYSLISHISDIYYGEEKGWKESYSGALVCKCVSYMIVSYLFVFFKGD